MYEELITKDHFVEVLSALHQDQTGLLKALYEVKKTMAQWEWIYDGSRGSYEWDDEKFYFEFAACLDAVYDVVENALERRTTAHKICCGKYGHLAVHEKVPIQMEFNFGREIDNYNEFVQQMITEMTLVRDAE
jgi:hypothetical protein